MLLLMAAVFFGIFLFSRSLRLEGAEEGYVEERKPDVRAYLDGKPVKSYLKE